MYVLIQTRIKLHMLLYIIVRSCKYVKRFVHLLAGCTSHHSHTPIGVQLLSARGV